MKKLYEVKKGDYYYHKSYNTKTKKVGELDKSLITDVNEDSGMENHIFVAFEEGNSWYLDTESVGVSISIDDIEDTIQFLGTCEESVEQGMLLSVTPLVKGGVVIGAAGLVQK